MASRYLVASRVITGPGKTTALRNFVIDVSSECVDNFHYYNQL